MKICWDNLEGFKLTRNGIFLKNGRASYVYKDKCVSCGEPYLTLKNKQSNFCGKSCAHKGRQSWLGKKHTALTIAKMSKSAYIRSKNKEYSTKLSTAQTGHKNHNWKGGVSKKGLPLYDTYNKSLWPEEVTYSTVGDLKLLNVKCTKCGEWFIPTTDEVQRRLKYLNEAVTSENRFYCSSTCKDTCVIYRQIKYPKYFSTHKELAYTSSELKVWAKEVLYRGTNTCAFCGEYASIAHHIEPKKLAPYKALDPDNGLACCETCHFKYGHSNECSTGSLSHVVCK